MWCLHFCPPQINHAFVGGDKEEPLPAAEPGLSAWPLARGGFKRVGARGSSHSHGRTTQGHQSKVSPCPSPSQHRQHSQGTAAPISTLTQTPKHRSRSGSRAQRPSLNRVGEINSGDGGKSLQQQRRRRWGGNGQKIR